MAEGSPRREGFKHRRSGPDDTGGGRMGVGKALVDGAKRRDRRERRPVGGPPLRGAAEHAPQHGGHPDQPRRRLRDRRRDHGRAPHDPRLPQLSRLRDAGGRLDSAPYRVPRRDLLRVRARDARGAHHPGRRGHHGLGRRASHLPPHPRRAARGVRGPDPRHRRHPRVDARRADDRRRRGAGRHRPVQPRLRSLRRGGPAAPRGARLARRDRDLEREAPPGGADGGGDVVGPARAVRAAHPAALGRRHPPGSDRDRVVADRRSGGRVPHPR